MSAGKPVPSHPVDPSNIYRRTFGLPLRPEPIPEGLPMDRDIDGRRHPRPKATR